MLVVRLSGVNDNSLEGPATDLMRLVPLAE